MQAQPWSVVDVQMQLQEVIEELDDLVAIEAQLAKAAVDAKHTYERSMSQSLLLAKSKGDLSSDTLRKAWAKERCAEVSWKADETAALHESQRGKIRVKMAQIEALRSLIATARSHEERTL